MSTRKFQAVVAAATLAWLLAARAGLEPAQVAHTNMLVLAAAAVALAARNLRRPWTLVRGRWLAALAALAIVAVANYANYGAFHGMGVFVHAHDAAHYYLGSKYFAELGYTDLYTAMLRAQVEDGDGPGAGLEARDLASKELVPAGRLLAGSAHVKERFTAERWAAFRADAARFRGALGPHYQGFLRDHGYNPTPLWTLIGSTLTNRAVPGDANAVTALCLLDPLLLAVATAALAATFGTETALLAVVVLCTVHGATFSWVGGAMLRHLWLVSVVVSLCAVRTRRPGVAGAALALAAMLRIFPVALLAGPALTWLGWRIRDRARIEADGPVVASRRRRARFAGRMLAAFTITAAVLAAATAAAPRGLGAWLEFRANITAHHENVAPNLIGLTSLAAWRGGPAQVSAAEFQALKERRSRIHRVQMAVLAPALLATLAWVVPRLGTLEAMAAGLVLALATLNLGAYYWAWLVVLVPVLRERHGHLAALLAVEAAVYVAALYTSRDANVYMAHSAALAVVLPWLLAPARRLAPARTGNPQRQPESG